MCSYVRREVLSGDHGPRRTLARRLRGHSRSEQAHSSEWGAPPAVPRGFAVFGADETVRKLVPAPPDAHWTEFPHGKHLPAMEAPADLAADLRAFFGPLQ